jgi:hypothetical protein
MSRRKSIEVLAPRIHPILHIDERPAIFNLPMEATQDSKGTESPELEQTAKH